MWVLGAGLLLFGLLVSIALHEVGHLVPAKRFKAHVTEYMVGFGPKVWSFRRGETDYGVRLIPLGGYIRMLGMFPPRTGDREEIPLVAQARASSQEELGDNDTRAFWRLSARRKLVIMLGGPLMNLALWAVLTLVVLLGTGVPALTSAVQVAPCPGGSVPAQETTCSPAQRAGVLTGDAIVSIGGTPVDSWEDILQAVRSQKVGDTVELTVRRSSETLTVPVTLGVSPGQPERPYLGVSPVIELEPLPAADVPAIMGAQLVSIGEGVVMLPVNLAGLVADTVSGSGRDEAAPVGVVGLGRISGDFAAATELPVQARLVQILALIAGLNLALFAFNLVPLLPLDGGHVASALYEGLRRQWARLRHKPDPGPADTARLIPISYAVAVVLIAAAGAILVADLVNPLRLT